MVAPIKRSDPEEQESQDDEPAEMQEPQSLGVVGVTDQGGVLITQVLLESPAAAAGLSVGDIVIALDQKPMGNVAEQSELMTRKKPGSKILINYLHAGREMVAVLTIGQAYDPAR